MTTRPAATRPDGGETLDAFYHGRVRVLQRKKGYRFSVDAPLLADFIRTREGDEALEIGTGSGVVALLLSVKPFRRVTALEIQPGLADLARRNVELNGLGGRIEVVEGDLRTYDPGRTFDLVFSNPPYIKGATGFLGPSAERSAAKHELHGTIAEITERTAEWLAPGGRACFVYPERRRADLLAAAQEAGLGPRRLRFVHPREGAPANLILVELAKGGAGEPAGAGPEVMPPLVLFGPDGHYTAAAEAVFSG
ncbi:MAG: methyltransferase [Candidatus Aminicenantes bacterium]|nr:methyltransferase [Candidatus Aminicenantes bacterium]NLH75526.1 methyltransferase [Acidobacteriota bacterium]